MIDERELAVPVVATPPGPGAVAWAVAALLVVACVVVDPAGLVPTGPLRWTAIALTTGVALAALFRGPVAIPRPWVGLWFAFTAVLLLATVRAVDPLSAWIGTPDRRLGFVAWVMFPALFLAGYACAHRAAARLLGDAGSLAAIVIGGWTLAELAGHAPLGLEFADGRAGGPFGQPAYLGAACLLIGPLAALTAFDRGRAPGRRALGAAGLAGASLALVASQTRAAWVGAAAVGLVLLTRNGVRRRLRAHLGPALAVGAVVVVVACVTPLGARAVSTFDPGRGTAGGRFAEWKVATRTITDHPAFGVGPEGYRVVFPSEVDAAYVRQYGVAVFPDRAHNGILDVTLAGGLAAGALYLALLLLVLRHAVRGLRGSDPAAIALGAAALGYVVQQQFLFPLSELDPVFWVLAGLLVARTAVAPDRVTRVNARWLLVPLVVATLAGAVFGAREVLADRDLRRAARTNRATVALRDADHATRLRPDSIRAWYVAARVALRGGALTDVDAALDRVEEGLDRSPRDPALRVIYGELLAERAVRSGLAEDATRAERELERLLADAPHDPRLLNGLVSVRSASLGAKP